MQGPSPQTNWSSSISSLKRLVAATTPRQPARLITVIPAPEPPKPSRTARHTLTSEDGVEPSSVSADCAATSASNRALRSTASGTGHRDRVCTDAIGHLFPGHELGLLPLTSM